MINLLLNASVTGGIVILLWLLTYPLSKKYFKASWHYAVLKISMVFLVLPISIFSPMFNNMLAGLFAKPDMPYISEQIQVIKIDTETINTVNTALSAIVFPESNYTPSSPKTENKIINDDADDIKNPIQAETISQPKQSLPIEPRSFNIPYLQIIWLIAAALLFAGRIRKMHKFKKQILKFSSSDVDRETQELFLQCRNQLKVRGIITLRTSEYIKTPLTFGLIRPFVVFPETDMNADEKRYAFTHELTHIKNGDLWIKFFAFIISVIHWFNPFTHLLCRKISVISEEYCDECVTKLMTKEEMFSYGNLILKVVCDISAPQAKYCSTLSAPTKNLKRRLLNMVNTKKSRRSMVALSVLVALILCSFATIYAFAANTGTPTDLDTPKNLIIKLPEANIITIDTEKDIDYIINSEFKVPGGVYAIGYVNSFGEITSRISRDGGVTWLIPTDDGDYENYILDPDISAIEWLSYDEYKVWFENKKAELSYKDIEYYEVGLEDVKNGVSTTGKVIIENREIIFVFNIAETSGDKATYGFGDGENYEFYIQEELDEMLAFYESVMNNGGISTTIYCNDGEVIYTNISGVVSNSKTGIDSYVYTYIQPEDGEKMGFGGDTFAHLKRLVKDYFNERVEAGKMTREEADGILAGITKDNTRVTVDKNGNIIG